MASKKAKRAKKVAAAIAPKKPKIVKTTIQKMVDRLNSNHYWDVDVDYDRNRHCTDDSCGGVCRCSTIENISFQKADVSMVVSGIAYGAQLKVDAEPLLWYCIDRICRAHKVYREEAWSISVCGGYYGEELDVSLDWSAKNSIANALSALNGKNDCEKVKSILEAEYGYLLDKLKPLTKAEIVSVPIESIRLPNDEYGRKVSTEDLKMYEGWEGICGVVVRVGDLGLFPSTDQYRLIDGYHRIMAAKKLADAREPSVQAGKKMVDVVVLS